MLIFSSGFNTNEIQIFLILDHLRPTSEGTDNLPWAFKLCLATVTGPSLLYMTVGLGVHCTWLILAAYSGYMDGSFGNF